MSETPEMPIDRWSDDELLRAAQDGNNEAFRVFCVRSLPVSWRCNALKRGCRVIVHLTLFRKPS
jgi:hypothetical protein